MSGFSIETKVISGKKRYQVMFGTVQIGALFTSEAEANALIEYRESLAKAGEAERAADEKNSSAE